MEKTLHRVTAGLAAAVAMSAACSLGPPPSSDAVAPLDPGTVGVTTAPESSDPADESSRSPTATPEPDDEPAEPAEPAAPTHWQVGASPLPERPDGLGEILPTPPELVDRRLPTPDLLPAPPDERYAAAVETVPEELLARSTWHAGCPVAATDLRYLTMSFWGFDGGHHTGEMLVHADVADAIVTAFGRLHADRFPIEEMRVTAAWELDTAPTGDGNNTSAFVCRAAVGSGAWSAHASGLAVDVNPFVNPYVRSDGVVLPELASAYVDRGRVRDGMILEGDVVTAAFDEIGWTWGGRWSSPSDLMHFSATGG
ncbi:D-alanyl-D-alanine carboxypeptidase [Actinoalloteichus sp. GBA129-24]|uniref:D-alanyl-D-alanine carboxypeptidase n=2 Tax=Actinoalloteichus TaxID=65496 RepID=A0AAC9L9X2_9PSEU|nr:D-alanyl-D-alanine carboxypeptidase [Actinoalloteichus fjordicus]APU19834.1 D-alanyl-D-alanine carboxypeptidase [Actinoalloteichus sp. GBA129-24]